MAAAPAATAAAPAAPAAAPAAPAAAPAAPAAVLAAAAVLVAAVLCLVIGLRLGRSIGWDEAPVLVLLPLAPIMLGIFWRVEQTAPWPVLPLNLLRNRGFAVSSFTMFIAYFCTFVIWFIFPFYVADHLGRGPATIGVLLGINALMISGFAGLGGWLSDRIGTTPVGLAGMLLLAAGLAYTGFLGTDSSLGQVAIRVGIVGIGLGLFQASAYALMMGSVPAERFGTAGATLSLAQAVGSVLAIAIIGGVFAWRNDYHSAASAGLGDAETVAFMAAFKEVFLMGSVLGLLGALSMVLGIRARNSRL